MFQVSETNVVRFDFLLAICWTRRGKGACNLGLILVSISVQRRT